jgi:hypothetical protein
MMRPENTRVLRKGLRESERGIPTGRRATHPVRTTYGRKQRDHDWREALADMRARFEAGNDPNTIGYPDD